MRVTILYLAAGNSRRFGENKLLYPLDGKAVYRHLLDRLAADFGCTSWEVPVGFKWVSSKMDETGAIIGGVSRDEVIIDERIIETDFGKYELHKYSGLGPRMSLYWALPEVFPAPPTVETVASMVQRSREFLQELEQKDYENVLVSCHGGIIRALTGYMMDRKNGICWRPKPHNCEIRVFESVDGKHRRIEE